jgi:hypothetical protein
MGNYAGQGFGYVYSEFGIFEVKHENGPTEFTTLSAARKFYDMIDPPKAIWDCTKIPELLDAEI